LRGAHARWYKTGFAQVSGRNASHVTKSDANARIAAVRSSFRGVLPLKGVELMNKNDLIDAVAESAGLTKADAGRAVDAVVASVTSALKKGDSVTVVGFGTFQVRSRAARTGRNPKTGENISIPASNNPVFKAGKALKDAVN
jgi:DNA-binding protein HU-beta